MIWLFTPRWNLLDVAVWTSALVLTLHNHLLLGLVCYGVGTLVSVAGEIFTERRGGAA